MPITSSYNIQVTVKDTDGSTNITNTSVYATNLTTGQRLTGNNIPLTGSNGIANVNAMNIGPYSNGDEIEIYCYKSGKRGRVVHTINTTIGEGTETITLGISVNYCRAEDVAVFLGIKGFTEASKPSFITVEDVINAVEDEIDFRTGAAWRTRYSNTTTGHITSSNYEWHDIPEGRYDVDTGRRIKLDNRFIKTIASGSGDELGVWNGSSYDNWVTTKTEGRANDFWLDYEGGVLYMRSVSVPRTMAIRIKYRYGESRVPSDVKLACMKKVAAELVRSEDRSVLFPDNPQAVPPVSKVNQWIEDFEKFIESRAEWKVIG